MAERGNNLSRRAALALGAAAAAFSRPAAAQQKLSQTVAKYQAAPKGDDHCGICDNFAPPNACKFVQGEISPTGWCQLYVPKG